MDRQNSNQILGLVCCQTPPHPPLVVWVEMQCSKGTCSVLLLLGCMLDESQQFLQFHKVLTFSTKLFPTWKNKTIGFSFKVALVQPGCHSSQAWRLSPSLVFNSTSCTSKAASTFTIHLSANFLVNNYAVVGESQEHLPCRFFWEWSGMSLLDLFKFSYHSSL